MSIDHEEPIPKIFQNLDPLQTFYHPSMDPETTIYLKFTKVNPTALGLPVDEITGLPLSTTICIKLFHRWHIYQTIMNSRFQKFDFSELSEDELITLIEDSPEEYQNLYEPTKKRYTSSFFGYSLSNELEAYYGNNFRRIEYVFIYDKTASEAFKCLVYEVVPIENQKEQEEL